MPRPAYFDRLLSFLRRRGRSREDAEDLIQEAMIRLHVYCQAKPVGNEEAFLRQTVQNLSVDQHRRDRLDLRREVPFEEADTREPFVQADPTPEQVLDAEQRLGHIEALLEGVSRRTRDIYFAHRSGYSYAEISQHMGISHITIKRHIARALLAIMESGEPDDHGTTSPAAE